MKSKLWKCLKILWHPGVRKDKVEFANMWTGVYQMAQQNHQDAVDYSHEAMNKTSGDII